MKLVLASKNKKKLVEMNDILSIWALRSALRQRPEWT